MNNLHWHKKVGSVLQQIDGVLEHCSKMWSTHHLFLRSGLWWKLSKREDRDTQRKYTIHLTDLKWKVPHNSFFKCFFFFPALIKSWLANTSRDSFEFCQLLGKSGQARFMQHDLLHKGMEQGEAPVSPAELGELGMEKTQEWKTRVRACVCAQLLYWRPRKE